MADNILDAACQRESPQAAKRMRLDSDHEDGTSVPPSSLDAEAFVDPHHPNKVLEGLNRLRLNRVWCDVILCCEGQEVPCHRSVLAAFSPYFEAMFASGMRESTQDRVTISGLEPQMIGLLVNYAYTSEVSISADNVQALLVASDLLDVASVREACFNYMRRQIDVDNCVEIYCLADDHSCGRLKNHSMLHILDHFTVLYRQEAFLSLSVERLTELLSYDFLDVQEDRVFEAAMLWLDKCPTRKQIFGKVLDHIRLPLISPSYLHTVVERLDVVKEQQGCQRFISEAKGEQPCSNAAHHVHRGNSVIMMLGKKTTSEGIDKVESFDPVTNERKSLGRLPCKMKAYAVCASGLSLYLAGGRFYLQDDDDDEGGDGILSRAMWRYDVHHNSWLEMAAMNEPRIFLSLVLLDGYVFAVGGWGSEKSKDSLEQYNHFTDDWQLMDSVGVAAHYGVNSCDVVALDGHLYFIGCAPNEGNPDPPQGAKYNPKTSVWTQVPPMEILRDKPAACILNGKIYVTGGRHYTNNNIGTIEKTMECYNPQTNQWTMCASMKVERYSPSMVVLDENIYVLGGQENDDDLDDSFRFSSVEHYREVTDTWMIEGAIRNACIPLRCVSHRMRKDHGRPFYDTEDDSDDD